MALTDIQIRNAKPKEKDYKLSDASGLYALIKTNGTKCWRLKYRIAGKEKVLSIGTYPLINLATARDKAMQAKEQLLSHIDPSLAKKEKKLQAKAEVENSFETVARQWHENKKQSWTVKHGACVLKRLSLDVFPALGFKPIAEIKPSELLSVIRAIEARGAIDIAHRAVQTCGQIFRYAVAAGIAERDITADLRGALKTRKKENHSHLLASELPEFMQKLENYDGDIQTKLALNF